MIIDIQQNKELRHIKLLCRILTENPDRKNRLFNTACLNLKLALLSNKMNNNKHNTLERKQQVRDLLQQVKALRMA